MSVQASDARWVGIIKQYYWNDTDEEMMGIVEASISGWQSDVSAGTNFDPEQMKTIVGGIVLLSATFGYPGVFKDSIEKICSLVIRTQRIQMTSGVSSWTSVALLSLFLPNTTVRRARLPEYENLVNDALPRMDTLPRKEVPSYRIAWADNDKMAEVDEISTVYLEKVIGVARTPRDKKKEAQKSSGDSQELRLSFSQQSSPMDE